MIRGTTDVAHITLDSDTNAIVKRDFFYFASDIRSFRKDEIITYVILCGRGHKRAHTRICSIMNIRCMHVLPYNRLVY